MLPAGRNRVARGSRLPPAPTPPDVPFGIRRFLPAQLHFSEYLSEYKHPALPHGFRPLLPASRSLAGICSVRAENSFRACLAGSALCRLVRSTRMASADFCPPIPTRYRAGSAWQADRPPRVMRATFIPYTRRLYSSPFRMAIGLWIPMPPRPRVSASYAIPVRRAGTLPPASSPQRLTTMQLLFS